MIETLKSHRTQSYPCVYQYELHQPAWPPPTRIGYYIVEGKKYSYRNPGEWQHYTSHLNNTAYKDNRDGNYILMRTVLCSVTTVETCLITFQLQQRHLNTNGMNYTA